MSNSYFQFKQFRIEQDKCGMKVSTDACIQGAWTPILPHVKNVLDIGAGTGLLSLMLAQRNSEVSIDAIELNTEAATQAKQNAALSPWSDRVNIICDDVREHLFDKKYDLVICNPPFFQNSLKSVNTDRLQARHDATLSFKELFNVVSGVLKPGGYCSILLPVNENDIWEKLLQRNNMGVFNRLLISPAAHKHVNRVVSVASFNHSYPVVDDSTLCIYESHTNCTPAAIALLSPFYLNI
jgi:tRNA1Val (adenine37-N6)-methyltransferase